MRQLFRLLSHWSYVLLLARLIMSCLTVFTLLGSMNAQIQLKRIESADIVNLRRLSDPQISPDGKLIAYVVDIPVKAGEHRNAHIWIVPTDGKQPEQLFVMSAQSDTSPRWSPDGKTIAFLSDRTNPIPELAGPDSRFKLKGAEGRKDLEEWAYKEESRKHDQQIWALSLTGGEAHQLTSIPGGVRSFTWSRDSKVIGFLRRDGDSKEEKDRKGQKNDQLLVDHDYHFDRLWLYTVADCTMRLVTRTDVNINDFDLSPDGTKAVVRVSVTPRLNDYWYLSKIVVLDTASGETLRTLTNRASSESVRWFHRGNKILYGEKTTREIADTTIAFDLESGRMTRLGENYPATLHKLEWNPDGQTLMAEGVQGTRKFFAKVDASSGDIKKVTELPSNGSSFTQSEDGQVIAYLGDTPSHPNEVYVYSKERGSRCLTETNPQIREWSLGTVQEISWISTKDQRKIYGVLVLPPDYKKGIPHKMIVHAHGGPFEAWQLGWLGTWYQWEQLLASHGYVVLAPNPRGSQGQGAAFQEANFRDWGAGDFQDLMDGVDMLVRQKIADPARLGIGGWSYGGFMTSWTITHTDQFKAAVVGAAVTDLYGMSTTTDIAPSYLTEFFGNFVTNRALYDEHSPMRYIERCHTPALVLHGDADERVPTFQGEEFYKGLKMLDREAELVRYPREPHIFTEREHQIDMLQRIVDWYDAHLEKNIKSDNQSADK